MQRLLRITFACAVAAQVFNATAAESRWPAAVAAELKGHLDVCREVEGKPDARHAITAVDLNGDGVKDYVVDVGQISCEGAWSVYGDREKPVSVFVGGKRDATPAFADTVYEVRVEPLVSGGRLWLTVAGAQCGRPPAKDFASESFCERALVWNRVTRQFDYAALSAARMIH